MVKVGKENEAVGKGNGGGGCTYFLKCSVWKRGIYSQGSYKPAGLCKFAPRKSRRAELGKTHLEQE